MSETPFERWVILELMGHRVRPGLAREVEIAGAKMIRIDIPSEGGDLTEFYSPAAIYSMRPVSEEIARAHPMCQRDPRPVRPVEYRDPEPLPAPEEEDEIPFNDAEAEGAS